MMRLITLLAIVNGVFSWNPNNYPFLPASADSTKVRNMVIEAQGPHKRILDIGCGLGYSTSEGPGCLGIDRNKYTVKKAMKLFPDKNFRHSFTNDQYPNEKYDVVTCMFYLNDLPQYLRQKTIKSAIDLAEERVVIVDISPDYIPDALKRFKRERPKKWQGPPHSHTKINYGAKQQFAKEELDEPEVSKEDKKYVQQVLGTFLYYARAVDPTMLVALSAIASEQAKPTKTTMEKVDQFLDYAASQEEAVLTYHASDMVLAIHSDASYLSESKARSRAGGHFFMSKDVAFPPNNGAVLNIAQIMKSVMSSAAEAEIGAMYVNAREAVPCRRTLEEMGHRQPRSPMQTDNLAAHSVVTNNVQPRRTKAMDMRVYWLRCRDAQGQFR